MIVIVYSWTILDYQYYFYYERCKLYESVQFKEKFVLKSLRCQQLCSFLLTNVRCYPCFIYVTTHSCILWSSQVNTSHQNILKRILSWWKWSSLNPTYIFPKFLIHFIECGEWRLPNGLWVNQSPFSLSSLSIVPWPSPSPSSILLSLRQSSTKTFRHLHCLSISILSRNHFIVKIYLNKDEVLAKMFLISLIDLNIREIIKNQDTSTSWSPSGLCCIITTSVSRWSRITLLSLGIHRRPWAPLQGQN